MHISVCIVNVEWNKFDLPNCGDPPYLRSGFEHPTLSLRLRKCVGQSFSTAPLCCRVRCARAQQIQIQGENQNTILKYKLYWREHPSSKCGRSWGQIGEVLWKSPNSDGSSQCKSGLFPHRILSSQVPQMYSSSTSTFPYFKHFPSTMYRSSTSMYLLDFNIIMTEGCVVIWVNKVLALLAWVILQS